MRLSGCLLLAILVVACTHLEDQEKGRNDGGRKVWNDRDFAGLKEGMSIDEVGRILNHPMISDSPFFAIYGCEKEDNYFLIFWGREDQNDFGLDCVVKFPHNDPINGHYVIPSRLKGQRFNIEAWWRSKGVDLSQKWR